MSDDRFSPPYLGAAFLCEKAMEEKDGVHSFIRVVDTFTVPTELVGNPDARVVTYLVIMLKSGEFRGEGEIRVALRRPSGTTTSLPVSRVLLEGGVNGAMAVIQVGVKPEELGEHWFDVFWDARHLTSVPMRLVADPKQLPAQTSPETDAKP